MLCEQDELSENDIDTLTDVCLGQEEASQPLQPKHIQKPEAADSTVQLTAIRSINNVNGFDPNQEITFGKNGLTVVYGMNGSGKSGYARILKRVCRVRSREEQMFPNVYVESESIPEAEIEYTVNGDRKSTPWRQGEQNSTALSAVSVFDAAAANVHVNQENDVAYTPFPIKLLEKLASTCDRVRNKIESKVEEINRSSQLIRCPEGLQETAEWQFVHKRLQDTDRGHAESLEGLADKVESLEELTDEQTAWLGQVNSWLEQNSAKYIRDIAADIAQWREMTQQVDALVSSVSTESCQSLHGAWRNYVNAQKASAAAASKLFQSAPLNGVGSETWLTLWEAARRYAEQEAYPEEMFPRIDGEAKCVLCQQDLLEPGQKRMSSFEDFIKGDLKEKEQKMFRIYEFSSREFKKKRLSADRVRKIVAYIDKNMDDQSVAPDVKNILSRARWMNRQMIRHPEAINRIEMSALPALPRKALEQRLAVLQGRKAALEGKNQLDARAKLRSEYAKLKVRQWLYENKNDVLKEIKRRQKIACLRGKLQDTKTRAVTIKSSEIAEKLITSSLCSSFSEEIAKLNKTGLEVRLEQAGASRGAPSFRVALSGQKVTNAKIGEILSEGEFRCVALAAFLAELATSTSESAIVFDDPVSSFDHAHMDALAGRLVDIGGSRQVIVFTHSPVFRGQLQEYGRQRRTEIAYLDVAGPPPGACRPGIARPKQVSNVIERLQKRYNELEARRGEGGNDPWRVEEIKSFYRELREAWELAVEYAVSPVLWRFSDRIYPTGFGDLTALNEEDNDVMQRAYRRCNSLVHSDPPGVDAALPNPDEMKKEIDGIMDWVDSIKKRRKGR